MRTLRTYGLVAALMLALAVTGCTQSAKQDPAALEGVQWTLQSSSEAAADLSRFGIIAEFDGAQLAGFSGVNSYSGPYTAGADGSFSAGPLASTMMAGPQAAMDAESAYLELLGAAKKYEVTDGKLTLTADDGKTLVYEGAEPPELTGTSWKVTNYNNGNQAVVGVDEGTTLTLEFAADGRVTGNGGVNNFNGPFTSDKTAIKIGPLVSTKMAGPEAAMKQEQLYLVALQAATEWDIARGTLTLRDAGGAMQVVATSD